MFIEHLEKIVSRNNKRYNSDKIFLGKRAEFDEVFVVLLWF